MKTIVVPTDFSEVSLNAVNYAADLACVINAELSLIHVCLMPMTFSEAPVPAYNIEEFETGAEERLLLLRSDIMNRTRERIKINTIVRTGSILSIIEEYCTAVNPYAVVMGAESENALERVLLGGITVSAVKQLSWPLIVVPPFVKFSNLASIGLACDLRHVEKNIPAKEIRSLVNEFHAALHILHISPETGDSFSVESIEQTEWLRDMLGDLHPRYHFIKGRDIEKDILEFADHNKLDLLIIIPKKHTILNKLLTHSHSKRLVLHAHIPVMAIHE